MKKNNLIIMILVTIAIISVYLIGRSGDNTELNTEKVNIATTIYPIFDIAKNIAGDTVKVTNILPTGASPHTFELTPEKVKNLQGTNILFAVGHGLDNWASDLADNVMGLKSVTVDKNISLLAPLDFYNDEDEGESDDSGYDPHYWLSVENAKIIATTIADNLKNIDPNNTDQYQENLDNYISALTNLYNESKNKLSELSSNKLLAAHDALQYFGNEFGLETVGAFQPSPGSEPTPQELAALQQIVSKYNVKALFVEPQLSQDTVEPFATDIDLPIYILDPLGGSNNRQTYIDLIKYNVDTVYQALK